jgi:hypothetical protein
MLRFDRVIGHQSRGNNIHFGSCASRRQRNLTGMKGHMTSLDALGGQGAQGARILRQAHRCAHTHQLRD